jgi:dolichol-phosphate mannosyltransferase
VLSSLELRDTTTAASSSARYLSLIVLAQAVLGARVLLRLVQSAHGRRIGAPDDEVTDPPAVSVVVPVLNEYRRLGPCLDGLATCGTEVGEILVVDGGSTDGTQALVRTYTERDRRVRLVDATPIPVHWNGKAWGLQVGLDRGNPALEWVLTVDADVRVAPPLARALLAHARRTGLPALSLATLQDVEGLGGGLLHPALLSTVIYRHGGPGRVARTVGQVQANGQCFLARRHVLCSSGAFAVARASRCEDVTVARALVAHGHAVGFYESDDLASVKMYEGWRETWRNWPRSLPLRDQFTPVSSIVGLCEVSLAQALPLPLLLILMLDKQHPGRRWMLAVNGLLMATRLGVLVGMARAYRRRPWSYWGSPLCDVPVACRLWGSLIQRRHVWRGRMLLEGTGP